MLDASPPDGFALRAATLVDAPTMADLINEVNIAEVGFPWTNAEEVRDGLSQPDHESDNDVLLFDADQRLRAYLWMTPPDDGVVLALVFVAPALWGLGLSTWLLSGAERISRAKARVMRVARWQANDRAARLFESLGYSYARTFHVMRIDLTEERGVPPPPEGIGIRTFDPERDREDAYAALADAFAEHWGRAFESLDEWVHGSIEGDGSGFDPGLWFLALDGPDIVGVLTCREHLPLDPEAANVTALGVRRDWRGRGIGRALLLNAFAEVASRGAPALELEVDSLNETGALGLYESVGMRVKYSFEFWDKTLTEG